MVATPEESARVQRPRERDRSIEAILARSRERRQRRVHTFPPDFLHGGCRVDALYREFGRQWCESAAFVEVIRNSDGELAAWTLGTFDEGFLTIEHAIRGETDDFSGWLSEKLEGLATVVVLDMQADWELPDLNPRARQIPISCEPRQLLAMERRHLSVTRERKLARRADFEDAQDEVLLDSRLNVTSLVCLCGRLA